MFIFNVNASMLLVKFIYDIMQFRVLDPSKCDISFCYIFYRFGTISLSYATSSMLKPEQKI